MSDSDSFINEVNEEVRRDRLYALFRKWGWVAGLVIIGVVGGAAWIEYQRSQTEAQAQAFGDALLTGLDAADPEARVAALDGIETDSAEAAMILALLQASEEATAGDRAAAAARLRDAADAPEIERRYRDLALLRAEMLDPGDPAEARIVLEALAAPGSPYAGLAQEQLALLALREGDVEGALSILRDLENSAAATAGLQQRASQLIVALEAGSTLVDSLPEGTAAPEGEQPEADEADAPTDADDGAVGEAATE